VRVVGVQTARLPSMVRAVKEHHPVTLDPAMTIADGIAVRRAGDVTYPLVAKYVDEIVTVDEDEIASAILTLLEKEKTLAEGAGATALAALLQRKTSLPPGLKTAVLVCGGNIDVTLLSRIIERGLVQDGRLMRLRIHLLDKPGALLELTEIIANHRVNIVDTLYNRAYYGVNLGDTAIDITMETRGRDQAEELLTALAEAGYKYSRVL
jgi:threonine dehydratase